MAVSDPPTGPVREHRVHADTLEYTRTGLRTRAPIDLEVGAHNRVVIVRPKRVVAIEAGSGGFALESAFPLPGTLATFWTFAPRSAAFAHPQVPMEEPPRGIYQVYGHTSASGDEAANKLLADRRARLGLALLIGDVDAVKTAAEEETWGLQHAQAMLRMLAVDPGAIDGEPGARTETAVAQFQERYNRGIYHRRSALPGPSSPLEVNGHWEGATRDALLEAFVVAHAAHIPPEDCHPTHPANGCSEYNSRVPEESEVNRRVTLVIHPELPPHHDAAPCTTADETACAVVGDHPSRCMWFREHVIEKPPAAVRFFDPRWLWLGDDRYLLSALTNAVLEDEVEFEVFESQPRDGSTEDAAETPLIASRSERIRALNRLGIVQVVWVASVASLDASGRPEMAGIPSFVVRHVDSGASAQAPWPETDNLRVLVGCPENSDDHVTRKETFRLWTTDGAYDATAPLAEAVRVSPHRVAVEFQDVPRNAKLCLSYGYGDANAISLFADADAETVRDNCTEGRLCRDVPPPEPPKTRPSEEADDHPDAVTRLLRENLPVEEGNFPW